MDDRPEGSAVAASENPTPANFGHRAAAFVVDVGFVLLALFVSDYFGDRSEALGNGFRILAMVGAWLAVTTLAMGITGGQTLGKKLIGIRAYKNGGARAGLVTSLIRDQALRLLYIVPFFVLVDSLYAAGDQRRTLRDRWARTYVAYEPHHRGGAAASAIAIAAIAIPYGVGFATNATGVGGNYSASERKQFVDGCAGDEDSGRQFCGCLFDFLAKTVPYKDFEQIGRLESVADWPSSVKNAMNSPTFTCPDEG